MAFTEPDQLNRNLGLIHHVIIATHDDKPAGSQARPMSSD
jgi:hypothetical protein